MKKVSVFFGTGFEEIEALAVVDLLRREDIETDMVSITEERTVQGSHNISVGMDKILNEVDFEKTDVIVLPGGGMGTRNLEACKPLMEQVDDFVNSGKTVCAICAAPSILGHRGHLQGRRAIAYPGFEKELTGAEVVYEPAVTDGNIITGRGMGCAVEFGLAIVEYLKGKQAREELAEKIVFQKQ
ncbi:MAG: DJ-1/PfpI family protein [Lachnospiraceae bacterium]|nr:DJ-1/PfpI family protein [Lachnospiraceae bacterium]